MPTPTPQLLRQTPALFSSSAPSSVGQFGSLVAGTPATSTNPNTIQGVNSGSYWAGGWPSAVVGTNQPALEDMNGLFYWISYYINYAMQAGIPEYDSNTAYYTNNIVSYQNGSTYPYGVYVSQTGTSGSPNLGNALNNTNYWLPLSQTLIGANLCKAWVVFDGTSQLNYGSPCNILGTAWNVSSVIYNGQGIYTINFINPLSNANFSFAGSAGAQNGVACGAGDNNIICGAVPGYTGTRTTNSLQIFCWESSLSRLENSGCISVQIFGN